MNAIDITISILILFGAFRGFTKGFFVELATLAALVLGTYGAIHFSGITGGYLSEYIHQDTRTIAIISFIITFISIVWGIHLLGKILTKTVKMLALGLVNRILGAIFGGLKWALLVSIVLFIFSNLHITFLLEKETINQSIFYEPLQSMGELIYGTVIEQKNNLQSHFE